MTDDAEQPLLVVDDTPEAILTALNALPGQLDRLTKRFDKKIRLYRQIGAFVVVVFLVLLAVVYKQQRDQQADRAVRIVERCAQDNREREGDRRLADAVVDGLAQAVTPPATPEAQAALAAKVEAYKAYLRGIVDEYQPARDCSNT